MANKTDPNTLKSFDYFYQKLISGDYVKDIPVEQESGTAQSFLDSARTSMAVTIGTKNKIKSLKHPNESDNAFINRTITELTHYQQLTKSLKAKLSSLIPVENTSPVSIEFQLIDRTTEHLRLYNHFLISFSYNKGLIYEDDYVFDVMVDRVAFQGEVMSLYDGYKCLFLMKLINGARTNRGSLSVDETALNTFKQNDLLLHEIKLITYFKMLYSVITNKPLHSTRMDEHYLNEDFWRRCYDDNMINETSFKEDVVHKLEIYQALKEQVQKNARYS